MAKSFLTMIGVPTPGSCVNQTVQQNEGVNPVLKDADAIVPYSIAKYIAQRYHSAKCLKSSCAPVSGVECKPASGKNLFGCDEHGHAQAELGQRHQAHDRDRAQRDDQPVAQRHVLQPDL